MRQILLQNVTAILLQNAAEVYYKIRQVFFTKYDVLSQNATVITNCDSTINNIFYNVVWKNNSGHSNTHIITVVLKTFVYN